MLRRFLRSSGIALRLGELLIHGLPNVGNCWSGDLRAGRPLNLQTSESRPQLSNLAGEFFEHVDPPVCHLS